MIKNFEFKDGDIVKDKRFNKSFTLKDVGESSLYPLEIKEFGIHIRYTLQGRVHYADDNPSLVLVKRSNNENH